MSQDDLSSRENQKPPSRRRSWIVGLNVAAGAVVVLVFAGVALSSRHGATEATPSPTAGTPTPTPTIAGSPTAPASGTSAPAQFFSVGADQYSCDSAGHIHSVLGGSKVPFSFVNDSSQDLQIIWLNYLGARINERLLLSGSRYNVDTFIGHDWMVADHSSDCLAIFSVTGPGSVTLVP